MICWDIHRRKKVHAMTSYVHFQVGSSAAQECGLQGDRPAHHPLRGQEDCLCYLFLRNEQFNIDLFEGCSNELHESARN